YRYRHHGDQLAVCGRGAWADNPSGAGGGRGRLQCGIRIHDSLARRWAGDCPQPFVNGPDRTARWSRATPRYAGNLSISRICRGWGADELWRRRRSRFTPSGRHLCGPHSQGREGGRSAGPAGDENRADYQHADGQGARDHLPAHPVGPRRRGDRMTGGNAMHRRSFLTLLGASAAAWPLGARAQQRTMPVIGILEAISPSGSVDRLRAFRQGLKESGFVEGENVSLDYRWAENQPDRLPGLASDLVRRRVAVIAASGNAAVFAAKGATTTTPIVFRLQEDPVKLGLVASLARPGGNLTGVNFLVSELTSKRLELLHELVPGATRVAALINPANAATAEAKDLQTAAHALGLQIQVLHAS